MKTVKIPLTQGRFTLVDAEDFAALSAYKWHTANGYVKRTSLARHGRRRNLYMHREIMKPMGRLVVDHRDGNKLNNTKANLRVCTSSQNHANAIRASHNTSGYKGVSYDSRWKKWRARLHINKKEIWLGYFSLARDAALAYDKAARLYFGRYALTNFKGE